MGQREKFLQNRSYDREKVRSMDGQKKQDGGVPTSTNFFFSHSSAAPWSGVCSQSSWPRMFNVFLLGSSDDLIVSKLGLCVVTLKLAPNAAWYYFGSLLPVSLSLSLFRTIYLSLCVFIYCKEVKPTFSKMYCRCKVGSVVAIWKSACRPGMEN